MNLFLIRHAWAEDALDFGKNGGLDQDRPLTAEGIKKFRRVAAGLKQYMGDLSLIAVSPYLRAQETAQILSQHYADTEVVTVPCIQPLGEVEQTAEWLLQHKDIKRLAMVGHEPHLSSFLSYLVLGEAHLSVELKKASCARIQIISWQGLKGGQLLKAIIPPKIFKNI